MKHLSKLLDLLQDFRTLSSDLKEQYLQYIIKKNTAVISAVAFLSILIESFMIIRLFISHPAIDTPASKVYLGFYVTMIAFSLLLLFLQPSIRKNTLALYWFHFSFAAAYLLWNIFLNSYDLYRNTRGSSLAIVMAIVFVSIIVQFKPQHTMILQSSAYTLFYLINEARIVDKINATIAVFVAVVANILFYYQDLQQVYRQQRIAEMNEKSKKEQLDGAKHYLRRLRDAQERTSIYHHDLRHTLTLIDEWANHGNLEKIQEFISANQQKIENIKPSFYCEHETVNLILGSFDRRATANNVILKNNVQLPAQLPIEDTELCSLLYNLLENALHAVSQVEGSNERYIFIKALIHDESLVILVENPFIGEILMNHDRPIPQTSLRNHGFGVQSIIDITQLHHGLYFFEHDDHIFRAKVLLKLA
ncbi:MAG: ATP-binding protein [Lachnospiraceae bacterium]